MVPVIKIASDGSISPLGRFLTEESRKLQEQHTSATGADQAEQQIQSRALTDPSLRLRIHTCPQLLPVTFDNWRDLSTSGYRGFTTGHALPKQFLLAYFELLEEGKFPTGKLIAKKLSKYNPDITALTIEEIKTKGIDPAFHEAGYEELSLFPSGTALLASVYSAYKDLKDEGGPEALTLEKLCSHIDSANLTSLTNGLVGIKNGLQILAKLDPDFGRFFDTLQFDALEHQIESEDRNKAISKAHNWIPAGETLDLVRNGLAEDLSYSKRSSIRGTSTAGEYLNLLHTRLCQIANEKLPEASYIKARTILFQVLREKGLTEQDLIVGWSYWNVRGENQHANMKKLIEVASQHALRPLDFEAVNDSLTRLQSFSKDLSFPTDVTDFVCEEVKKRISYGQDSYKDFLHTILEKFFRKKEFEEIDLNPETLQSLTEKHLGLTRDDYAIYKACQALGDHSEDATQGKAVRTTELIQTLESKFSLKLDPKTIRKRLAVIESVTSEKFTLTESPIEKWFPKYKDLDPATRRRMGLPQEGHYKMPPNLQRKKRK